MILINNLDIVLAGVKITAKELNFQIPKLHMITEDKLPHKEITGMYLFKKYKLIFNEDLIKRSDWIEVIITIFHEMRHAYRGFCIRTQSRKTKDKLVKLEYEFTNYIMPYNKITKWMMKLILNKIFRLVRLSLYIIWCWNILI